MKDGLKAIVAAVELLQIRVTAIESALIDGGRVERDEIDTFRVTAEPIVLLDLKRWSQSVDATLSSNPPRIESKSQNRSLGLAQNERCPD
jgi:hypothetical protein